MSDAGTPPERIPTNLDPDAIMSDVPDVKLGLESCLVSTYEWLNPLFDL